MHNSISNDVTIDSTNGAQPSAKLAVSSQLTYGFRLATPFAAGSQICAAYNAATGQTEVFSIGNDGHVYRIYFDPNSDTGWSKDDLSLQYLKNQPTIKIKHIDAGTNPDGSVIVYAVSTDNWIYAYEALPGWGTVTSFPTTTVPNTYVVMTDILGIKVWYETSQSNERGMSVAPFTPLPAALCSVRDIRTNDSTRNTVAMLLGKSAYEAASPFAWYWVDQDAAVRNDWCPAVVHITDEELDALLIAPGAYYDGTVSAGPQTGLVAIQLYAADYKRRLSYPGTFKGITIARNSDGTTTSAYDELFAISEQDSGAYYFSVDFDNHQLVATKISDSTPLASLAARTGPGAQIEVFALGTDGFLYHIEQDTSATTGWSDFLLVSMDLKFSQIISGKSPDLNSEVFAVTTDNRLFHIWRGSADDEWQFDEVALAQDGKLEKIRAFCAQLTLYDVNDVPVQKAPLKIFSDDPIWMNINGVETFIDSTHPWAGNTNAMGQVTLTLPTESLGAPTLAAWASFMPPNDRIALNISAPVQDKLSNLTPQDLLDAQMTDDNGNQTPLLDPNYRDKSTVNDIVSAMTKFQSLIDGTTRKEYPQYANTFNRYDDSLVTQYLPNSAGQPLGQIDMSTVEEQHWQVTFTSGRPVFRELSREDAFALIAEKQASTPTQTFWGFWGDVFDAIAEGIASIGVSDFIISIAKGVKDAINATITLVIEGVTYLYNGIVSLVEQVFDLMEEVFRGVKRAFVDLFSWIASHLPVQDIARSKEAVAYAFMQLLDFAQIATAHARDQVVANIDSFENLIKDKFDKFIQDYVSPNMALGDFRAKYEPTTTGAASDDERRINSVLRMNVFQNALIDHHDKVGSTSGSASAILALDAATTAALDDLIQQISAWANQFQSAQAFKDALDKLTQIKDHPEQFMQLALSSLLSIFEGLALLAFDIAKVFVTTVCNAFIAALDAFKTYLNDKHWTIPIVSDLYQYFTGEPLQISVLDIISMTVAAPATILHKLFFGVAPFADDAALQTFKNDFTSAALVQWSSLGGKSQRATLALRETELTPREGFARFFSVVYTVNDFLFIFVDTSLDANVLNPFGVKFFSISSLVSAWVGMLSSLPWWESDAPPSCGNHEQFGNLLWMIQLYPPALDTAVFVSNQHLMRSYENQGPIVSSVIGGANFVLTCVWGVWAFIDGGSDWADVGEGFFGAIPGCVKFLGAPMVTESTEGASLFILGFIDIVGDALAFAFSAIGTAVKFSASGESGNVTLHNELEAAHLEDWGDNNLV